MNVKYKHLYAVEELYLKGQLGSKSLHKFPWFGCINFPPSLYSAQDNPTKDIQYYIECQLYCFIFVKISESNETHTLT